MITTNENKQFLTLSGLSPVSGSRKVRKRIGRGDGSGYGGTAGKGHKGDKARSGYKAIRGFEGGQMPLQRRLPKFGFKSHKKVFGKNVYTVVSLDKIQALALKEKITVEVLVSNGLVKSTHDRVKVLGGKELKSKLSIEVHAFSASAKEAITQAGGEALILS